MTIEIVSSRRAFIRGLGLIIASPAIVRVASLMPMPRKRTMGVLIKYDIEYLPIRTGLSQQIWRMYYQGVWVNKAIPVPVDPMQIPCQTVPKFRHNPGAD